MAKDRILMDWKTDPIKMLILSKLIYRFNTIPNKIPAGFFVDIDRFVLKFMWKGIVTRLPKINLNQKNKVEKQHC